MNSSPIYGIESADAPVVSPLASGSTKKTWVEWIGSFFGWSVQHVPDRANGANQVQYSKGSAPLSYSPLSDREIVFPVLESTIASLPNKIELQSIEEQLQELQRDYPEASLQPIHALRQIAAQVKKLREFFDFLQYDTSKIKGSVPLETKFITNQIQKLEGSFLTAAHSLSERLRRGISVQFSETTVSFEPLLQEMKQRIANAAIRAQGNRSEFEKSGDLSSYRNKDAFDAAEQVTNRSETALSNARSQAVEVCSEITSQLVKHLNEFIKPSEFSLQQAEGDSSHIGVEEGFTSHEESSPGAQFERSSNVQAEASRFSDVSQIVQKAEDLLYPGSEGMLHDIEPLSLSENELATRLYDASLLRVKTSRAGRVSRNRAPLTPTGNQILEDLKRDYPSAVLVKKRRIVLKMIDKATTEVKVLSSELQRLNQQIAERDEESQRLHGVQKTIKNNQLEDTTQVVLEAIAALKQLES